MSAIAIPVAQFAVRTLVTAIWVLILSKLIRMTYALGRRVVRWFRKNDNATKK